MLKRLIKSTLQTAAALAGPHRWRRLPGALVILCLALGYAYYGDLPLVQAIFTGIQAAVNAEARWSF